MQQPLRQRQRPHRGVCCCCFMLQHEAVAARSRAVLVPAAGSLEPCSNARCSAAHVEPAARQSVRMQSCGISCRASVVCCTAEKTFGVVISHVSSAAADSEQPTASWMRTCLQTWIFVSHDRDMNVRIVDDASAWPCASEAARLISNHASLLFPSFSCCPPRCVVCVCVCVCVCV